MRLPFSIHPIVTGMDARTGEHEASTVASLCESHAHWLIYHNRAKVCYQFGSNTYTAHAGSLLLLPPSEHTHVSVLSDGLVTAIGFFTLPSEVASPVLLSASISQNIRGQMQHLLYLFRSNDVGGELAMLSDLYAILYTIQRYSKKGTRRAAQNNLIRPSVRYLEKHELSRKLNMKEVAALSGISESHFRALFLLQFGCTPMQFLNSRKMEQAKLLLRSPLPIKEIARSCGFSDPNYFARAFQKSEGMSPSEYRKNLEVEI